jgi:hypothetical protein
LWNTAQGVERKQWTVVEHGPRCRAEAVDCCGTRPKVYNKVYIPLCLLIETNGFFFFFFYWVLVASAPGSTAACRLTVRARLLKFPLVPPGAPTHAVNNARDF